MRPFIFKHSEKCEELRRSFSATYSHRSFTSYLPFPPLSLLDALFRCVLRGSAGFLQRLFTNQSYSKSLLHEDVSPTMSHKASYNIFKVAVQSQWLCVLLQSLWSQPVPLFITPQAFLFLPPRSLLRRRAAAFLQRSMRYEP